MYKKVFTHAFAVQAILFGAGIWSTYAIAADEPSRRIGFYQDEASKLSSSDIFKDLERQRNIKVLKNRDVNQIFAMDDDSYKAAGYAFTLEKRRKSNEPAGAFFYGVYNWGVCNGLQSMDKGQLGDAVKNCWLESFESFKVASAAQVSAASFNIGRMYENGSGVMPSKFVAAEWFVKAAEQYNKAGSRDEGLASVEAALNAVPDHPAALRLKKAMLK